MRHDDDLIHIDDIAPVAKHEPMVQVMDHVREFTVKLQTGVLPVPGSAIEMKPYLTQRFFHVKDLLQFHHIYPRSLVDNESAHKKAPFPQ